MSLINRQLQHFAAFNILSLPLFLIFYLIFILGKSMYRLYHNLHVFIMLYRFEDLHISKNLDKPFHRLTYTDALQILNNRGKDLCRVPEWGEDLHREHEHVSINLSVFNASFTPV